MPEILDWQWGRGALAGRRAGRSATASARPATASARRAKASARRGRRRHDRTAAAATGMVAGGRRPATRRAASTGSGQRLKGLCALERCRRNAWDELLRRLETNRLRPALHRQPFPRSARQKMRIHIIGPMKERKARPNGTSSIQPYATLLCRPRPVSHRYQGRQARGSSCAEIRLQAVPLNIIDNGHTIQINYPAGSSLTVGDKTYALQQIHFHHPSEEQINDHASDMVAPLRAFRLGRSSRCRCSSSREGRGEFAARNCVEEHSIGKGKEP